METKNHGVATAWKSLSPPRFRLPPPHSITMAPKKEFEPTVEVRTAQRIAARQVFFPGSSR